MRQAKPAVRPPTSVPRRGFNDAAIRRRMPLKTKLCLARCRDANRTQPQIKSAGMLRSKTPRPLFDAFSSREPVPTPGSSPRACFARKRSKKKKKQAAWFPKRPFLSYGSLTFNGRSQNVSAQGPISRGHILIGSRCLSGQSRTEARAVAVVSHLRKMTH